MREEYSLTENHQVFLQHEIGFPQAIQVSPVYSNTRPQSNYIQTSHLCDKNPINFSKTLLALVNIRKKPYQL